MTPRALISVTDKAGVVEFARALADLGFSILSTGGTFRALQEGGVTALEVASYTGFPELMQGRLKTLHPKVHGGLLGRRDRPDDVEAMQAHGIDPIDLVAVNLYRFRDAASRTGVDRADVIENIDIGGPAMIRSAAKNHADVAVIVDPTDYDEVVAALRAHGGRVPPALARRLAGKAYAHTAAYDSAIAAWFDRERRRADGEPCFGESFGLSGARIGELRYGENRHQEAALYADLESVGPSLARARQLGGKALSYNNLLDLDAALGAVLEFEAPCCAVVKHNNPCGTATADLPRDAFRAAHAADALSAFGGVVALNRELDVESAVAMAEEAAFLEAIIAPSIADGALDALQRARWGKNVRVLSLDGLPDAPADSAVRSISGGFLVQTPDRPRQPMPELRSVGAREPSDEELEALRFAWLVCKHVKSNAIVLARPVEGGFATVGVGAGQMSRVESVRIAVEKAGPAARGSVLASDAFFPFADGLEVGVEAGVTAAIQPGGAKRDDEVVAAADAAGVAMVFTGQRHFRH